MSKEIETIQFPPYYPNVFIQALENDVNPIAGKATQINYNADIISLVNDNLLWADIESLVNIFKEIDYKILLEVYEIIDSDDVLAEELMKEHEINYSTFSPNWLMSLAIRLSDLDNKEEKEILKKSKKYLNDNYIIESKVLIFPSQAFGPSNNARNVSQKNDYYALKFWKLTSKNKSKLTKEERKNLQIIDTPLMIFLGLFKLNLTANNYQSGQFSYNWQNQTFKELTNHKLLKNYSKQDRFYVTAKYRSEKNEKIIDMSVLREIASLLNQGSKNFKVNETVYEVKNI